MSLVHDFLNLTLWVLTSKCDNLMPMSPTLQTKQITDASLCAAYGTLVRAGRNALGISQNALASILGVHRTTLVRLEQGVPPLRTGLCLSALEVLKKAGVECLTPEMEQGIGLRPATGLNLAISSEAIAKAQQVIDQQMTNEAVAEHLLGTTFTPPLAEKPLRKK